VGVAFFDLDRTLLAVNSASLWIRREVALGHVSRLDALKAAAWMAGYHLGLAEAEHLVTDAVSRLAGTDADAYQRRMKDFFELTVRHRYRPGALEALKLHRARGETCVILSSTTGYLADLIGAELGFDAVLCNRFERDASGLLTGRLQERVCFGRGKLFHAKTLAAARGERLEASTFYSDSASDLPVLEEVGTPVAVNPDPRLKRTAERRRWRIVDWGEPPLALTGT
jgi:HAD superfamily hydrolase (TIGR01490 family)